MNLNNIGNKKSSWDLLAERFNTYKPREEIHPDAAVNIEVGWPIFLKIINNSFSHIKDRKLRVLDFGCGAGEFCKTLLDLGYDVTGLDNSESMVSIAKKCLGNKARIIHGDHKSELFVEKAGDEGFDVVTSMHSLEWVEEIDLALNNIVKVILPGGLLIFAVFPREHVRDSLIIKDLFEDFDSQENPYFGYANFDGVRVPVWVRNPEMYDDILKNLGLKRVSYIEPDYPRDFFKKYNWTGSRYPEMMIMAYRKP